MVAVVGGVMSIQGDGSTAHKAKDHSRVPSISQSALALSIFEESSAREGEPDALKDACPVRERLYRDRLFARMGMAR